MELIQGIKYVAVEFTICLHDMSEKRECHPLQSQANHWGPQRQNWGFACLKKSTFLVTNLIYSKSQSVSWPTSYALSQISMRYCSNSLKRDSTWKGFLCCAFASTQSFLLQWYQQYWLWHLQWKLVFGRVQWNWFIWEHYLCSVVLKMLKPGEP